MSDGKNLVIDLRGIAHILRDQVLEVPPFQRNYSWISDQIDEYWFDLRAALTTDQPVYFMGTLVLGTAQSGGGSVIDGQQRLTTTSIFLAVVRDIFDERGDHQRASTIQNQYLASASLAENRIAPRLKLNPIDQDFFESAILKIDNGVVDAQSRTELAQAYSMLGQHLRDDVEAAGPKWQDRLLRWVKLLDERTQVITVNVEDDADAFIIFETLNDRGMELSVADLIKNYLLSLTASDIAAAQEAWVSITHSIEQVASSQEVTPFIRQWWSSRRGSTRERDLYKSLRSSIHGRDDALDVLRGLASGAPAYAALLDSNNTYWSEFEAGAAEAVAILNELGFEQYRPLALAALQQLPAHESAATLQAIVSWSIRGLIAGGIGGGSTERAYAEAAVRVSNGRAKVVSEIYVDVSSVVAPDREFASSFAARRVLRSSYLRYLLRALFVQSPLTSQVALDVAALPLFPRSDPHQLWGTTIDDEVRKQLSARLGNFGLFSKEHARSIPDHPSERLEHFRRYDQLNPLYGRYSEHLTADSVDERQRLLALAAPLVWPLLPRHSDVG